MIYRLFRKARIALVISSCSLLLSSVHGGANDASAMLEAGGIRLVENHAISLDFEDLYISPAEIRIHYEFSNQTDSDQTMLVAFPVPDVDADPEANYGSQNIDPVDFLDFSVRADGVEIKPDLEIRLTMNGIDHTDELLAMGVPEHRFAPNYYQQLDALSEETKLALADKGLIDYTAGEGFFYPKWKIKATYSWTQTFPARSTTVLEHSYHPVLGGGIFSEQYSVDPLAERFCIDQSFRKGLARKVAQSGRDEMLSHEVRYILRTANTWLGPIGEFRLVIDKMKPENLISLCINGIRKIAPTQFEFRATNYTPDQDLDILVVRPPDWDTN